jgi:hypothetical protein
VEAWFNFEEDERGKPRDIVSLACDVGEKPDDWAVIETVNPIPDAFPALPIVGARVPQVDDRVCIIQHPGGQTKKVAWTRSSASPEANPARRSQRSCERSVPKPAVLPKQSPVITGTSPMPRASAVISAPNSRT